jgi:hypothetical protein
MKLDQWVAREQTKGPRSKKAVIKDLAERSQISTQTLEAVAGGMRLGRYGIARAVSAATGWEVSIPELCEENPAETLTRFCQAAQVTP